MPIPDEQAGPAPKRETPGIAEKHRSAAYDLCNRRLRNEITDDELDDEIRKLEEDR